MHAYDILLIVSVACVIGFTAVIYVDDDLPLALGYVAAAIVGPPVGGWLFYTFLPVQQQFALILGAFLGGLLLAFAARWVRHSVFPR